MSLIAALGVLLVPVLAAETAPSPAPVAEEAPAPRTSSARHRVAGVLRVIDVENRSIAFDDEAGKPHTWPVNETLAANSPARVERLLQVLKPGQKVWVTYDVDEGGRPHSVLGLDPWTAPKARTEGRSGSAKPEAPQ
jgi:hypothetical protein